MAGECVRENNPREGIGLTENRRIAREALQHEAAALQDLATSLPEAWDAVIEAILARSGRVITCGIGKSGHIARKAAGTLSSTGTPANFLHAGEATHGDLGMVTASDTVLLYSQSGETDEIVRLIPSLRAEGTLTVLITGRADSSAGRLCDYSLSTGVTSEACPHNLAPTTSTTAMLALSDALAITLMVRRGFGPEDFARFHPSGALGRRLLLRVSDVMRPPEECCLVSPDDLVRDVIAGMTQAGIGMACVCPSKGVLASIVAESDLRRWLLRSDGSGLAGSAGEVGNPRFQTVSPDLLAYDALEIFQNHPKRIGEVPVIDAQGRFRGVLVLKDLLRSGIVS